MPRAISTPEISAPSFGVSGRTVNGQRKSAVECIACPSSRCTRLPADPTTSPFDVRLALPSSVAHVRQSRLRDTLRIPLQPRTGPCRQAGETTENSGGSMSQALKQFGAIAATLVIAGWTSLGWSQDVRHYRFAYDQPRGTGYSLAGDIFAEKLKELSKGTMIIDQYPGAQLGQEPQVLQLMKN